MAWMQITHDVRDLKAWSDIFTEIEPIKREYGWTCSLVFTPYRDSSSVIVYEQFESEGDARSLYRDKRIRAAMSRGGVTGQPNITAMRLQMERGALVPE